MCSQNRCGFKLWVLCFYPPQLQCIPQKSCVWLRSMHLPSIQMDSQCMLLTYSKILCNPIYLSSWILSTSALLINNILVQVWGVIFICYWQVIHFSGREIGLDCDERNGFCLTCFGTLSVSSRHLLNLFDLTNWIQDSAEVDTILY